MKIVGKGVDIIQNSRIKKAIKNKSFVNRIFTKSEISSSKIRNYKTNYFAKRFAAKEAFIKSIGTGIRKGINLKNIEVSNNAHGKPSISLKGNLANYLKKRVKCKKYYIHLSLSDDKPWAQATVIISYNK